MYLYILHYNWFSDKYWLIQWGSLNTLLEPSLSRKETNISLLNKQTSEHMSIWVRGWPHESKRQHKASASQSGCFCSPKFAYNLLLLRLTCLIAFIPNSLLSSNLMELSLGPWICYANDFQHAFGLVAPYYNTFCSYKM